MYLPAASAGKDNFGVRWIEGAWLGVRVESGESSIGYHECVANAMDIRSIQRAEADGAT